MLLLPPSCRGKLRNKETSKPVNHLRERHRLMKILEVAEEKSKKTKESL